MILKEIKAVSDLGENWTVLGTDNGDKSLFTLSARDRAAVVIVQVKDKETGNGDIVYFIGRRDWLVSSVASEYAKKVQENKLTKRMLPITSRALLDNIYKEWAARAKNVVITKTEKKQKSYDNVQDVEDCLVECLKDGVSDIHIEVKESYAQIRRRINGTIKEYKPLSVNQGIEWGRTIYNVMTTIAGTSFKPHIPQDALIDKDFGFVRLRGRVATAPCYPNGFKMVIRLLKMQAMTKPLTTEQLGYSRIERTKIAKAVSKPKGITCIAGTTGSGKSTTLQSLILGKSLERNGELAIMTVEDPVEYEIPPATQIPVVRDDNGDAADAFAGAIRTALRMDPDLLMVGEVRDAQSAALVQKIVDTGHPVFTTIHASGCIQTIKRFENLGVTREAMGTPEFISGFFYQKLLPIVCPHCAKTIKNGQVPPRSSERDIIRTLKIQGEDEVNTLYKKYLAAQKSTSFTRYLQDIGSINSEQAEMVASTYERFNDKESLRALYSRIEYVSDLKSENILFKGDGCKECKGTGIIGRMVCSEGLTPDLPMLEMISEGADRDLMIYWKKNGNGRFAIEDAVSKMRQGLVDPIDIEHEVGEIGSTIL